MFHTYFVYFLFLSQCWLQVDALMTISWIEPHYIFMNKWIFSLLYTANFNLFVDSHHPAYSFILSKYQILGERVCINFHHNRLTVSTWDKVNQYRIFFFLIQNLYIGQFIKNVKDSHLVLCWLLQSWYTEWTRSTFLPFSNFIWLGR